MQDNISNIKTKIIDKKYFFKLGDIKKYLVDDLDVVLVKLNEYGISDKLYENEYIELYLLILLIAFSCDIRINKYKFYLASSTIEKICEINNPNLCIDRNKTLMYKKGYENNYRLTKRNESKKIMSFKEILLEEINFSLNTELFRQII